MQFWGILVVVVTAAGLGQEGSAFVSSVLMTVYMLKPVWIHLCGGLHAQACICVQRSEVDVGIFPNSSPLCPLGHCLSLNPELAWIFWLASLPWGSPSLLP